MKKIIFNNIKVCSYTSNKAFDVNFTTGINIILGGNDSGKSALIRSIYYAMGVRVQNADNATWAKEEVLTVLLDLTIDGTRYYLIRKMQEIVLYDIDKNIIKIATNANEFYKEFNKLINLNAKFSLRSAKNKNDLHLVRTEFGLHPFVIEQDKGWSYHYNASFDLSKYTLSLEDIILYHLNIKGQRYFDLLVQKTEEGVRLVKKESEKTTILLMIEHLRRDSGNIGHFDCDIESFKKEVNLLLVKATELAKAQNAFKQNILTLNERKTVIEQKINNLRNTLLKCGNKIEEYKSGTDYNCFECGESVSFNSLLINMEGRRDIEEMIQELEKDYTDIESPISQEKHSLNNSISAQNEVLSLLAIKKNEIDLNTLCKSLGIHALLKLRNEELGECEVDIQAIQDAIKVIDKEMKLLSDSARKQEVLDKYIDKFREYRNILDNQQSESYDEKMLRKFAMKYFSDTFTGSRKQKNYLAHFFAILSCIISYSDMTVFPIVIDTPNQKGMAAEPLEVMIDFIIKQSSSEKHQLILATETIHDNAKNNTQVNLIHLQSKYLLQSEGFDRISSEMESLFNDIDASKI